MRVSDQISEPLLAGARRPVILLPKALVARTEAARLELICGHELAHLKRGDNWRLLLEHLLGGLFWMVPPYAALRGRAAAVREELCDRLALADAPPRRAATTPGPWSTS
jgi:beta-lactamase regulating signal transducer with metallopeptidase domain